MGALSGRPFGGDDGLPGVTTRLGVKPIEDLGLGFLHYVVAVDLRHAVTRSACPPNNPRALVVYTESIARHRY